MKRHLRPAAVRLLSLLALGALLLAPVTDRPALADQAAPVVSYNVEEWAVGAGLLYWADSCFADEFNPLATLKRKPAGGGAERTLEAINDASRCLTYQSMVSSGDGLYFVDLSAGQIRRMPLGEPYTPQLVRALTSPQLPSSRPGLVESGDHLYWLSSLGTIYRARKDGAGVIETVAATGATPRDLIVVASTLYWSDSTGIWSISLSCAALPCTASKQQFSNIEPGAAAHGLVYQFIGGFQGTYRLYWVERTTSGANNSYAIRYRSCNNLTVCFVLPPVGQIAPPATLLYASTLNWAIGELLLSGGNLYWTEADRNTVNNANGDVKRRTLSTAGTGADTIATGQARIDDRIFVAGTTLFFARENIGLFSLPLSASAIQRDFSVAGMEVTQAIQNLANNAPLVATKTTYVRAYGRQLSGPSAPNAEARLVGLRGGAPLPGSPLQPLNGVRALTTGGGFDRARLNDGWYFLLPASWTAAGELTLRLELDGRQIHSDPNRSNNQLTQAVSFQTAPPVCVMTVPVRTHTPLPSVYDPNFAAMVDQFARRWPTPEVWVFRDTAPVEELELCSYYGLPYPCFGPYELSDGWGLTNGIPDRDKVIAALWTRALLSFNPDVCDDIDAPVHFMGLVHPAADNGGASGYASPFSKQSWVQLPAHTPNPIAPRWNAMREGSVMAQELGHNYGRKHVDCNNPDDIDSNYPYPPCQIANTGAESYYGFDVRTLQPIRPDETADFMSYAARSWVSDYTWRALLGSLRAETAVATLAQPLAAPAQSSSVFVTGLVDAENSRGAIVTLLVLPAETLPPTTQRAITARRADLAHTTASASFSLRLLGPSGAVLVERPLALTLLDDHSDEGTSALFNDLFPQPGGPVAKIQLLADGAVIDTLTPGAAAPTVTIAAPAAGTTISDTLTIGWSASDPDSADRLRFTVQYSHDAGASWHTLALDQPAGPDLRNSLSLSDLGSIHGSGANGARIRVLASDGYNTTIATSSGFTLTNRPPEPVIIAPVAGQSLSVGQPVILRGAALDPEDGGLAGAALVWSLDGAIQGSGAELAVNGLAPGEHTVQLRATDSSSNMATATAAFRIAPLSVPLAGAPTLDGVCDDPTYAGASSVALKPYADGAQATALIMRSNDHLWACFSGLQLGGPAQSPFVGLHVDPDHSGGAQAQASDAGFFAGADGAVFTRSGDGAGGLSGPGPGGLQAQVAASASSWSAELRLDRAALGSWDHLVGLSLGHYGLASASDVLPWPYAAETGKPATWAATALGLLPVITSLEPFTVALGAPALTLTVIGSGFTSGTLALWDGAELPTTFEDEGRLTVQVAAERLSSAASAQITTRSAGSAGFVSNGAPFVVQAQPPLIASLTPAAAPAGRSAFSLTVKGENFAPDAQVLWNGQPLATERISAGELRAQVTAPLLDRGQSIGVAVRNQLPSEQISAILPFTVEGRPFQVSLPLIRR